MYTQSSSRILIPSSALELFGQLYLLFFFVCTVVFYNHVLDWQLHALKYLFALVLFTAGSRVCNRPKSEFLRALLRTVTITLLCNFLFESSHSLQHIFVPGWMDAQVLTIETQYLGVDATLWFQQHMSPWLTEIMMFAYTIYVPLLPFIALFAFWGKDRAATMDYLFNLAFAYFVCYTGFLLYPVASPLYYQRELYTIPLDGYLFTWFGEWMRHNVHHAGGSLPSPHCAAATVMLVMMWKYNRKVFWPLLPVVLILYVSTVYGRYHYVSDGVVGIIAGVVVLLAAPALSRLLQALALRINPSHARKSQQDIQAFT